MEKVGYAIIGFGGIAENRIAKEGFGLDKSRFNGHPEAELIGATDINKARKAAATALDLKWYASTEELLNDPRIQAVFIATNNLSHAPLAEQAIKTHRHCIIEKPFATNLKDAQKVQRLAEKNGISITVDHMMTDNVYNIRARDLVKQGVIGQVNDICLHMEFLYGSTPQEAATWRCASPDELGGPIGDVASHCLYMAEFLLDSQVDSLACVYTPRTLNINVENGAFIQFKLHPVRETIMPVQGRRKRLSHGVKGTVRVAFNQPRGGLESTLTNLGYEIYGTKGVIRGYGTLFQLSGHAGEPVDVRLEIDTPAAAGASLSPRKRGTVETTDYADYTEKITNQKSVKSVKSVVRIKKVQNIYQAVISKHARSIIDKKPLGATEAIHNLRLILTCHESAKQDGKTIRMPGYRSKNDK